MKQKHIRQTRIDVKTPNWGKEYTCCRKTTKENTIWKFLPHIILSIILHPKFTLSLQIYLTTSHATLEQEKEERRKSNTSLKFLTWCTLKQNLSFFK